MAGTRARCAGVARPKGEVYNHAPLGHERQGKSLIAVETEQAAVAEVHRPAAQNASLRTICAHMQERGYLPDTARRRVAPLYDPGDFAQGGAIACPRLAR
jgi:hypothetical protein